MAVSYLDRGFTLPDRRFQSEDEDPQDRGGGDHDEVEDRDDSWDEEGGDGDDEQSRRDLRRFASETAFCPECGAEIYDAADVCPKCFTWIDGETVRHPRAQRRERFRRVIVWLLIGAMLFGAGAFAIRHWI